MKKWFWVSLFSFFIGSVVWALDDIEITGEADFNASIYNLPTSNRGDSVFSMPSLFLGLNAPLRERNLLHVSLEGAEQRDQNSKPFTVQTREAYLDLVSIFGDMKALRLGLIPQPWQESQYEDWEYRFLGPTSWTMTEKWRYQFFSDLGASLMSELPADLGEWDLFVLNGQGRDAQSPEPHKDIGFFLRFTRKDPFSFSLGYSRGTYQKYDSSVNLRERIQAAMTYKNETDHWRCGLELLDARDPADAITNLKMAEGVDVLALSGQALHGQAGSLYFVFSTGPQAEVLVRWDSLNAAVGESGKSLNTLLGALSYQVSGDIKASVAADYTKYGASYGAGLRDSSKVELAAQVLF